MRGRILKKELGLLAQPVLRATVCRFHISMNQPLIVNVSEPIDDVGDDLSFFPALCFQDTKRPTPARNECIHVAF